jgi:hypothetical protein
MSRLLPIFEIWLFTASVAPRPRVTMVTTAATPMTMPTTVRKDRVRLRRISRMAMSRALRSIVGVEAEMLKG